jgi:transposase-like protein
LLHRSRSPLTKWFLAIWHVTSQKYGANALGLQRTLDLGSYQTAWEWLHRLRRAMVRPDRDRLSGIIEMDETYVGGKRAGKRGRGAEGKVAVGVAVEDKGEEGLGRIRLGILPDVTSSSLRAFILQSAAPGSAIRTDGLSPYDAIKKDGYAHVRVGSKDLHLAHRVIALLKRWLLGTYQGAVRPGCLPFYLDEFTFRFNRRSSASRGKLFFRLVQQIVQIAPESRRKLVGRCKGEAENELDSGG